MDNTQNIKLKTYTLEEIKEEFIENKELYEFKLKVIVKLEKILKRNQGKPLSYSNRSLIQDITNLIKKIENE